LHVANNGIFTLSLQGPWFILAIGDELVGMCPTSQHDCHHKHNWLAGAALIRGDLRRSRQPNPQPPHVELARGRERPIDEAKSSSAFRYILHALWGTPTPSISTTERCGGRFRWA
jgi:hypothetical protein